MKKTTTHCICNFFVFIFLSTGFISVVNAQQLHVGDQGSFYLKSGTAFTTSNTPVTVDDNGEFQIEAGSNWGSAQEYVEGTVTASGTGVTVLPIGNNGNYAPVTADHSTTVTAKYVLAAPTSGSLGTDVLAVADVEYWELTGTAVLTLPWNTTSNIGDFVSNNGASVNGLAIVGYNAGTWDLTSAPLTSVVNGDNDNGTVGSDPSTEVNLNGYGQFTFGLDNQHVLATDENELNKGVKMVSNPVKSNQDIQFIAPSNFVHLNLTIYDLLGRTVRNYKDLNINNGLVSLSNNLKSGIYFLQFEHEGKVGVKKIIIE